MSKPHRDISDDAPGRIPESLIDAAIDGELDPRIRREIAHALKYDPQRSAELRDTTDAINALQMPVAAPDFTHAILTRADRHRRFIPRAWRKQVRAGRSAMAACLLLLLVGVAGLQRVYPRLTTLAAHPTPVRDVENAVEKDRIQLTRVVTHEVIAITKSVEPMTGLFRKPGRDNFNYEVAINTASLSSGPDAQNTLSLTRAHPGLTAVYMLTRTHDSGPGTHRPLGLVAGAPGQGLAFASWPAWPASPQAQLESRRSESETIELDVPDLP